MTTDRDARKQLLLTRIAFERSSLRRDLGRVRAAASISRLVRAALPASVGQAVFGSAKRPVSIAGWLTLGLGLLRRYRAATALLGGLALAPRRRKGNAWRRIRRAGVLAAVGAGTWLGWKVAKSR